MPGYLAHQGSTVICAHAGQAQPGSPNPRVKVSSQATVLLATPYTVAGCSLPPQAGGPCVTGQWTVGSTRATSTGQPLVIQGGTGTCMPTGVPMTVTVTQVRVKVQ
jgi:hypothetical protein